MENCPQIMLQNSGLTGADNTLPDLTKPTLSEVRMAELTQAYLKQILNYNPETGIFTWLVRKARKNRVGDATGTPESNGYLQTMIDGKRYRLSRLAWLYMTGSWPKHEVDHKDLCRTNNRWKNLREATRAQNNRNSGFRKANKTGFRGVRKAGNKFRADISRGTYLGTFDTAEEAASAFDTAARQRYGEFASTNFKE